MSEGILVTEFNNTGQLVKRKRYLTPMGDVVTTVKSFNIPTKQVFERVTLQCPKCVREEIAG